MSAAGLRESHEWSGEYRGVRFSIRCHFREWYGFEVSTGKPMRDCWCHYIYLDEGMVPPEKRARFFLAHKEPDSPERWRRFSYDYYDSAFADLEWHGGITYYRLHQSDLPGDRCAEAGCDYQHSWDDGMHYSVEWVEREVRRTIDSLHERHPDLYVKDWYDGSYHPLAEMVQDGERGLRHPSSVKRQEEQDKEWAERTKSWGAA